MKTPRFVVDVYEAVVYVCSSRAEIQSCMKGLGLEIEEHHANGVGVTIEVCQRRGGTLHVLGVFDGKFDTLAHEASHVTDMILKRAGIDDVHTEVRAYLLGYVTKRAAELVTGMKWPKRR